MSAPAALLVGEAIRDEFPILEHTTYLNSCSQGALSHRVQAAYREYLEGWNENGAEWEHWVERAETMRATFARIVQADVDEIAIVTSVSQAVSAVLSAIDFEHGPRKRIVIGDHEFPSVGQVAHAQELRGAEVVHVHPDADGAIPLERFAEAIDERAAVVCCATVSYSTGHRHDIAEIARLAHESGALCIADSYQALGAVDLDAHRLGVDVITGGTVKFLLGSAGLAFAYLRRETTESLVPTQTGWFADENIFAMDISDYSPARNARRFEAGTPPVPSIYAGVAGASIIAEAGTAAIERHVDGLAGRLIDGLDALGATTVTPRAPEERGPLVCVRSTDVDALLRNLAGDRIVASSRDGNLRIALHLYNTDDDVDVVLSALERQRPLLA
jgi:selenocysteine lyase/cysteine desulfurase